MKNAVKTNYELFKYYADIDIPEIISQVFGTRVRLGGNKLAEVSEAIELRLLLFQKSRWTPESSELLQRLLTEQLEIGKRYARARISTHLDPTELLGLYEAQVHFIQRWQLFYRVAKRLEDIHEAYQVAFVDYQLESLSFDTSASRTAWLQALLNEHQKDILQNQMVEASKSKPTYWLEERTFHYQGQHYRLSPTAAALLNALLDEEFHSAESLIRKTLGTRAAGKVERDKLSGNIYRLNTRLNEIWGKPNPGKHWVSRRIHEAVLGYQLKLPG